MAPRCSSMTALRLGDDTLAFGQQLVHVTATDDRSERGLGDLGDRLHVVLHVGDRLDCVDDAVTWTEFSREQPLSREASQGA